MVMLDQSLSDLYMDNKISGKSLLAYCNNRAEIEKIIGEVNIHRDENGKEDPYAKFFKKEDMKAADANNTEKTRK
jgi:hypothetical protein